MDAVVQVLPKGAPTHLTQLVVKHRVGPSRLDDDGVVLEGGQEQGQNHRRSNSDVLLALADPFANTCALQPRVVATHSQSRHLLTREPA